MHQESPCSRFEGLGAGVFVRHKNRESRLGEADFHRAFSEPVCVWITPGQYSEDRMPLLLDSLRALYRVERIRFPNVTVSRSILDQIQHVFPRTIVEGVKLSS